MTKKQLRELEKQRDTLNLRIRFECNLIDEHKERMTTYIEALKQLNLQINLGIPPQKQSRIRRAK
jgi:hypothetical protein